MEEFKALVEKATAGEWRPSIQRYNAGVVACGPVLLLSEHRDADASLPRAICLAIAAALGWEAPRE